MAFYAKCFSELYQGLQMDKKSFNEDKHFQHIIKNF